MATPTRAKMTLAAADRRTATMAAINGTEVGRITAGKQHHTSWVPARQLEMGSPYQRLISDRWAAEIARDFTPFLLRQIMVSHREDGTYWVIDGQHRVRAITHYLGRGEEEVECDVYEGLTYEEETLLCEAFVHAKPMGILDYLRIKFERNDPDAVALMNAVHEAGLQVALTNQRVKGQVAAAGALVGVYESSDGPWLTEVLRLLIDCFGLGTGVFVQPHIMGMHGFLVRYAGHDNYQRADFVRKVGSLGLGAVAQRAAVLVPTINGGNRATAFGKAMQTIYNSGRRGRFLPEWQDGVLTEKQRERRNAVAATLNEQYGFKAAARGKGRAKHVGVLEEDVTP